MRHTIKEACELTGKGRRTIYTHMKTGLLSYGLQPDGSRYIETSELMRVYGELKQSAHLGTPESAHSGTLTDLVQEIRELKQLVARLQKQIEERPLLEYKPEIKAKPEQPKPGKHQFSSIIEKLRQSQES